MTKATPLTKSTKTTTPAPKGNAVSVENTTFVFLMSWALWIILLSALSKTRVGYVLLYYSLLLMILFVLLTQYKALVPYITGISNIRDLDSGTGQTPDTSGTATPPSTSTNTK